MWPAFAAASASDIAALLARHFASLALGDADSPAPREPAWATPNTIALELDTVRLRDFSTAKDGIATLLCAPFALHGASVADLAPGHSLVVALREAGLRRLFVTDWKSATVEMRYLGIDDYLAALNVLVDELGGTVDLIGLCQGGWLSLLYAARFPGKVRKLALAGAPVDIAAGQSALSALAEASPLALFHELVKLGDGRVLGRKVQKFWGAQDIGADDIRRVLQTSEPAGSPAFAELEAIFRDWYAWTVDLPGRYYLEVIERLYKRNEIAAGEFVALGEPIDLDQAAHSALPVGGARRRIDRAGAIVCHRAPGRHAGACTSQRVGAVQPRRLVRGQNDPRRILAAHRALARRTRHAGSRAGRLDQPQSLEARVPFLADDDVVVHGNAERARHLDDRLRHLDVGARRRRIAGRMVVHQDQRGGR